MAEINSSNDTSHPIDQAISLFRQPVFDGKRHLWGYELFCVDNPWKPGVGSPKEEEIAAYLASGTDIALNAILGKGKKVIVDFNEKDILNNLPYILPPIQTAIKIDQNILSSQSAHDFLNNLKSDGYLIAIKNFQKSDEDVALFNMADIICFYAPEVEKTKLADYVKKSKLHDTLSLALGIEDQAFFDFCKGIGFDLYSGSFFKKAETVSIRKITTGEISRLHIFQVIEKEDVDFDTLVALITADATIGFRLLSYLNSAAFGFTQKIKSIRHAISLLGWKKVKNWLRVLLLTDVTKGKDVSELVFLAAQRSRFLESVSSQHDYWGFDPNSLCLLGLFSLLDVMLAVPMKEIVRHLPIDDKLKSALCGEANNEYLPLLRLAECFEDAKWDQGESLIQQLSLDSAKVKHAFRSSVEWANEFACFDAST